MSTSDSARVAKCVTIAAATAPQTIPEALRPENASTSHYRLESGENLA